MGRYIDALKSFCVERLGNQVRSIFEYVSTGGNFFYLRDDLDEVYAEQTLGELAGISFEVHQAVSPLYSASPEAPLGDYEATIHVFEHAYAAQFPLNQDSGCVLTFDRSADVLPHILSQEALTLIESAK
jgi:hypothetical protein